MYLKSYKKILASAILIFTLFFINPAENLNDKSKKMLNILTNYHYIKLNIDDNYFIDVKKLFIHYIDPYALIFTQQEVKNLISINMDMAELEKEKEIIFFEKTYQCYEKKLKEYLEYILDLNKEEINFNIIENIIITDNNIFVMNNDELKERWKKNIKYNILNKIFYLASKDKDKFFDENTVLKYSNNAKDLFINYEKKAIQSILDNKNFKKSLSHFFLKALCLRFDPHSNFFTNEEKVQFEGILSKQQYSFGIYLSKNEYNEIQVERLIPGGPAWKSFKINNGDVITEIKLVNENNKDIDFSDISLYEVYEILDLASINKITFFIRKKNGLEDQVTLLKEKIENEENIINSFILSGNKKIGYIYLPSFYTDWEQSDAAGCANDLAKEILKLKKENIDGIILDLRNNGGGSIFEALDLAGIFIDIGPVCIQKDRNDKLYLLKDINRGMVYDGPLVLLLNKYSASASELLASGLKDYNRAVIVGQNTYGKATAQIVTPIAEDISKQFKITKDMDFIKFTVNQYYNLKGESYQNEGIAPDITLTWYLDYYNDYEKNALYSIKNNKVIKDVNYQKWNELPKDELKKRSLIRINNDNNFQALKEMNIELKKYINEEINVPLYYKDFFSFMINKKQIIEKFDNNIKRMSKIYKVQNHFFDLELLKIDKYKNDINNELIKNIQEDIYIEESYNIILDYINLINKK